MFRRGFLRTIDVEFFLGGILLELFPKNISKNIFLILKLNKKHEFPLLVVTW
jgi:hypothetical protein